MLDEVCPGQVGDGARYAQDAVVGASRPLEVLHRPFQVFFALLVELAVMIDLAGGEELVALALALYLAVSGSLHARGDDGGGFAIRVCGKNGGSNGAHFHLDVDTVKQRAGDAILVA